MKCGVSLIRGLVCVGSLGMAFAGSAQEPTTPKPSTTAPVVNMLSVKYGDMTETATRAFTNSVAWWDANNTVLVLLFRNYDSPSDLKASPPEGGVRLFIMVRKFNGMMFDAVTKGTYSPIMLDKSMLQPIGALALFNKGQQTGDYVGAYWEVTKAGQTQTELWGGVDNSLSEWRERGTVTLENVSTDVGGIVAGTLKLGDAKRGNCAVGPFRLVVVKSP